MSVIYWQKLLGKIKCRISSVKNVILENLEDRTLVGNDKTKADCGHL